MEEQKKRVTKREIFLSNCISGLLQCVFCVFIGNVHKNELWHIHRTHNLHVYSVCLSVCFLKIDVKMATFGSVTKWLKISSKFCIVWQNRQFFCIDFSLIEKKVFSSSWKSRVKSHFINFHLQGCEMELWQRGNKKGSFSSLFSRFSVQFSCKLYIIIIIRFICVESVFLSFMLSCWEFV